LDGTDRDGRRQSADPLDAAQHPQGLRQRAQRRPFAALKVLDGVERDSGTLGDLLLIQIAPQPEGSYLSTKFDLGNSGVIHAMYYRLKYGYYKPKIS